MFTRTYPILCTTVLALAAALASCGGGTKAGGNGSACTPNTMSVPHAANDPCPQTSPNCPAAMGFVAVTTCLPTGTWDLMCKCVPMSLCGTASAQCSPTTPVTQTCASLNMGTGTVSCDPTSCKLNTSLCHAAGGVSGNGG